MNVAFEKSLRISVLAGFITLFLAIFKGAVGYLTNSFLLISDAIHSASDLLVIFTASIGIKIASKTPDERFPYGYYKAENLATLFISFLIIFAGYEVAIEGYKKLYYLPSLRLPYLALFTTLISIIISYWIAIHLCRIGRENRMQSLIAVGHERKIDALSSVFVFIGIILDYFNFRYVEGIFSIGIAILIFKIGIESLKDSIYALMDYAPKEAKGRIVHLLKEQKDIEGFNEIKLRRSGPFLFGEAKVFVKKGLDISKAHEIADRIEKEVKDRLRDIDSFVIHVEPHKAKIVRVAIPIDNGKISEHFGRAQKFLLLTVDRENKRIVKKDEIKNPYFKKRIRAGLACAKLLVNKGIDVLITKEIGEIAYHMLSDEGIEIYSAKGDLDETIKDFIEEKLEKMEKPTKVKE